MSIIITGDIKNHLTVASYSNYGVVELHKMGLSCFPEFNQSITLSILCYLPQNCPHMMWGNWGTKPSSFAEYCSRDSGWLLITPKDGKERNFQGFLSAVYRQNMGNYLVWVLLILLSTKSNLLYSLELIIPAHEFFTNTYTLHEMFRWENFLVYPNAFYFALPYFSVLKVLQRTVRQAE